MLNPSQKRYLRLLGFDAPPVGLAGLQQLVLRQLCRVPFENISKLLLFGREHRGRVTMLDEYLDGIEHLDLGGTCYTANPFFAELLQACGYHADLLAASMATPNVHTCIRVHLDGADYHVDVGNGAPFRAPMRIDSFPLEFSEGLEAYTLRRDEQTNEVTADAYAGSERLHGYRAHNEPRTFDFFHQTIVDSFLPDKTFMRWLRIARFFEQGSVQLRNRNMTVIDAEGQTTTRELSSMNELEHALEDKLQMPRSPIRQAVSVLEEISGQQFFQLAH